MAQLKNSVVNGDLIVTDSTLTDSLQVTTVIAPVSSGSYSYGTGDDGQALRSNGTTVYWGNLPTYSGMTESEIDDGTGTYNRTISPKNLKYAVREYETANSDNMMQLYYNGYTTMNVLDCYGISSATQKTSFDLEFNNEVLAGTYEFAAYIVTLSSVTSCTITFYNSDNSSVGTCQLTTNSASAHATVNLSDIAVKMTLGFSSSTTISIDSFGLFPKFLWDYAQERGFIINMVQPSLPTPLITQKLNKLKSDYDDVKIDVTNMQSQQTKIEAALINLINTGSKNRLLITASSRTHNGVTFTVNSDGTVTANGTASANAYIQVASIPADSTLFDGSYRLCGCPEGGSRQSYAQYAALSDYARYDYGESVSLIPTGLTGNVGLVIMVYAGYTANNVIFKPMICKKVYWDVTNSYVPYCPTNAELYAMQYVHDSVQVNLADCTWTQSGGGMYYSNTITIPNSPIVRTYHATLSGFANLRATDVITPAVRRSGSWSGFVLYANTNSFLSNAWVTVSVSGLPN